MILRPGLGRHIYRPKLPIFRFSRPPRRFQHNSPNNPNNMNPSYDYTEFLRPGQKSARALLKGLIGLNCFVAAAWQFATTQNKADSPSMVKRKQDLERRLHDNFVLRKDDIAHGKYWGAIFSNFSHQNVIHLGFNMMAFWSLGNGIIVALPQMNALRFLTLCTVSGLGSGIASYTQKKSQGSSNGSVGASGIVSGLALAIALRAPFSTMQFIFLPGISVSTWLMTAGFFSWSAYQVLSYDPMNRPLLDHAGHLGGAVFGALYYLLALRRAPFPRW